MCGFFLSNSKYVDSSKYQTIEDCLRFRGPDSSSGLLYHKGWYAYHARLSIIDLDSRSDQPMFDDAGGMLLFNGEILNYKEIGYKCFEAEFYSDTKLLSSLLSSDKLDISELDGFFSFVYVDKEGVLTHAVRDRFGVKPLYFYDEGESITFSSEPNVIQEIFCLKSSQQAIDEYYATRAPLFSGSYFEGVGSVEPGNCLISGQYFSAKDYIGTNYDSLNMNNIEECIKKGVSTRTVSDAKVGLLLSKGIDSNLIKEIGSFEKYYSIGFKGDADIEYLINNNDSKLFIHICNGKEYLEAFEYLTKLRKEPLSVPNEVLLYLVAKDAAKDGVKVLLSGEGADEFFGGYDRVFRWALNSVKFNLDEFLTMYCYTPPDRNSKLYEKFKVLFESNEFNSVFETVRWFFIRYHMPILFRRLDFSLMAAGVEGRDPFANMHTFLAAITISPEFLMSDKLGKMPLRDLACKYLSPEFAYDEKVGFPVDLRKIFNNPNDLSSYELWFDNNLKVLK